MNESSNMPFIEPHVDEISTGDSLTWEFLLQNMRRPILVEIGENVVEIIPSGFCRDGQHIRFYFKDKEYYGWKTSDQYTKWKYAGREEIKPPIRAQAPSPLFSSLYPSKIPPPASMEFARRKPGFWRRIRDLFIIDIKEDA